jgi:hypothetical protein
MNNDNEDNTITSPANDDDKILLENGILPEELAPEEREELLTDLTADGNFADNNEPSAAQSADENDGTNPA